MRFTDKTVRQLHTEFWLIISLPLLLILILVEQGRKHGARMLHRIAEVVEPGG